MASARIPVFAALYLLLFGALGAEVPFLPYFFATTGLSAAHIGLVLTAGTLAQMMVAPLAGLAADKLGIRLVLGTSAVAAALSFSLLLAATGGLWLSVLVYVMFAVATAPLNPLADALSVPACLQAGIPYGRVRAFGSAGFLGGILLSSAMTARFGVWSIVPAAAMLFVLMIVTVPVLPRKMRIIEDNETNAPAGDLRSLLASRGFRLVLLVATLVIGSHAMSDAFAVIHWRTSGIGAQIIGVLLAIAVGSELVVFVSLGPMMLRWLGPSTCATLGAAVGAMRWAILAETRSIWLLAASQLLHGLTFSLVHLACMQVLAAVAPRRFFATAQSLYGICANSIASAVITLAAGALFGTLHAHAFWLASCLCLFATPLAWRLRAVPVEQALAAAS